MMKSQLILAFSLGLFLLFSFENASAATQKIAAITNDEDKGIIALNLITDDNEDITHLELIFKDENNKITDIDKYKATTAANGIVLYQVDGRDVVKLSSDNFSSHQGGEIELDFLYNGITGSRKYKILDLSRDADKWILSEDYRKVKKLHFKSNRKAIVGTIGIKEIYAK